MTPARRYLLHLAAAALALLLPLWLWAWWDEPVSGDLTRIGAWTEREHGWRAPQPALTVLGNRRADEGNEVWVLGDSFSMGMVWQSVWTQASGWRVHTVGYAGHACIEEFIQQALSHPQRPHTLVVQTIERHLLDRLDPLSPTPCPAGGPLPHPGPSGHTATARPRWPQAIDLQHLWRSALNEQRWNQQPQAVQASGDTLGLPLKESGPFSHRQPQRLLVYLGDEFKADWTDERGRRAARHMAQWQALAQAQGLSLWWLVVPDKLSVYGPQVATPLRSTAGTPWAQRWTPEWQAQGLRVLWPLPEVQQQALRTTDFYLPNDTHLSPRGFEWLGRWMHRQVSAEARSPTRPASPASAAAAPPPPAP